MTRPDPAIGLVKWACQICGASWLVAGDADSDAGWDRVRAHRADHKAMKKEKA